MGVHKIERTEGGLTQVLDRRSARERRYAKNNPLNLRSLFGRRSQGRRQNDASTTVCYVDRYSPSLRYACVGVVFLSIVDAFFTLRILDLGGVELNPLMQFLLEWNIYAFVYIKLAMTTICLTALVLHSNFHCFNLIKVFHIIYLCFLLYGVLIVYELHLLYRAYSIHYYSD